ncbi:MAG: hypothetical protein PVG83_07135 [Acidimicrobiia bacterium]
MDRKLHIGTLLSGLALAVWGTGLLGDGLDWWSLELADLRYVGPILIIVIGAFVVVGALAATRRSDEQV